MILLLGNISLENEDVKDLHSVIVLQQKQRGWPHLVTCGVLLSRVK